MQSKTSLFPAVIVDARDIADSCTGAAKLDIPNGVELIASGAPISWKDIAALVQSNYPELGIRIEEAGPAPVGVDNQVLGMKWAAITGDAWRINRAAAGTEEGYFVVSI